jgi:hypothetical protein
LGAVTVAQARPLRQYTELPPRRASAPARCATLGTPHASRLAEKPDPPDITRMSRMFRMTRIPAFSDCGIRHSGITRVVESPREYPEGT